MSKDTKTTAAIDALGATAKRALDDATSLTDEAETKLRMTREAWRTYGQALLDAKALLRGTRAFGQWVRAHHLDTGLAKSASVRSNAMWVAETWADLQACKWLRATHPTELRREFLARQRYQDRTTRRLCFGFPPDLQAAVLDLKFHTGLMAGVAERVYQAQLIEDTDLETLEEQAVKLPGAIRRVAALRHLQAAKGEEQEQPAASPAPTPPVAAAESSDEERPVEAALH